MEEKIIKAVYGSADHPLKIGKIEIPCYVLEDGRRVLVMGGMLEALDMKHGGAGKEGGDRLAKFATGKAIQPFISGEILGRITNPIKFKLPNGTSAYAYEATLLADMCNSILEAREAKALQAQQQHIAKRSEILVRGFAMIGIIALVDEATGYQVIRDREALQKILEKYITDEWAKWTKTFPDEFYRQLFRLKNMTYPPINRKPNQRPSYIGHWTNDIVYSRLAPGVLKKLKEIDPRSESGSRPRKFHQHMTPEYGTPELRRYLENIIFLMKGCTTWLDFTRKLDRAAPKHGDQLPLDLGYHAAKLDEGDG